MNPFYNFVAERADYRCEYCRAPQRLFSFMHDVEHIFPEKLGGTTSPENLALACRGCNGFKSIRTTGVDPLSSIDVPLFNPRADIWHEHFDVDLESMQLVGRTSVGRATIQTLKLNSEMQLAARHEWHRIGWFP